MPPPVAALKPAKPYTASGKGMGKPVLVAGGVLGAVFLLPTVLAQGCKAGATVLGLPEGACPIISMGSCCCSVVAIALAGVGFVTK